MQNKRDMNHLRRLAGIPVDLSKPNPEQRLAKPTSNLTEAAKVPQHRGELSPKNKKNMRQRVSCAKKALEFLELAREELMQLPSVDYMEDIPDVIRQLHKMLHGEDGTGGLHGHHRSFQKEFDDMEFPEDLENSEPGMDGNPTEEEIKEKEKEREKKAAEREKEGKKKKVKEGVQAVDKMLQGKNALANSVQSTAAAMRGEAGNTADDDAENADQASEQEEKSSKPEWLEKAEIKAEEKEGKPVSAAEKKKIGEEINPDAVKAAKQADVAKKMLAQNPFGGKKAPPAKAKSEEEEKSSKKPEWLEKAEVKAEKKEGKSVSKAEKEKVGEAVNKDWTKPGSDLNKKFAADSEEKRGSELALDKSGAPGNVKTGEQGDLAYPVSDRSEGPNQLQTNPYNEGQKVHVPANIKSALKAEATAAQKNADMFLSRKDNDAKNFYEDMAKAFEELHMRLEEGTVYSIKQAQILMTSMMNIMTTKIPPEVVKFIAAGGTVRPLRDYMKEVKGNFGEWHIHPEDRTVTK